MMKEVVAQDLTERMNRCIEIDVKYNSCGCATEFRQTVKRPKLGPSGWIFHHDNAPAQKALSVKQFLAQNPLLKWNTYPLPLTWLRMTSDFPRINSALKGRRFQYIEGKICDDSTESHFTTRVAKIFSALAGSIS
jgi:hypothetical protein